MRLGLLAHARNQKKDDPKKVTDWRQSLKVTARELYTRSYTLDFRPLPLIDILTGEIVIMNRQQSSFGVGGRSLYQTYDVLNGKDEISFGSDQILGSRIKL